MLPLALGFVLALNQLSGLGAALPQIVKPDFKASGPIRAGRTAEVTVSFDVLDGYAINHTPPMTLKLNTVSGLKLTKSDFTTPSPDRRSKDEYYVDMPVLKVPVVASKAGSYEIPGKLTYFFCSKADGFCSRQILDVKIPLTVQ
jgi:hypothetical protein